MNERFPADATSGGTMRQEVYDEGHLRRYLLGELNEDEQQAVEQGLLSNDELFDLLLAAEDELIDDYVSGTLSAGERKKFESFFLSTSERQRKLSFAMALRRYITAEAGAVTTAAESAEPSSRVIARPSPVIGHLSLWWKQAFSSPYLRMAAAAVIVIGLGLGIWRVFFHQSEVAKGMAALAKAYRVERPTEARITGLNYAPLSNTRGAEQPKVDELQLNRAERILLDEVIEHPNSASAHHALGRFYLSEKKFDMAITQFDEALKGDANNAQLHSDYGASLLEKAKASTARESKAEDYGRALQQLDRALELDSSLSQALFNRALCLDAMMASGQAEEAWKKYIELDSSSQWADEAKRRLQELEERNRRLSDRETLFGEFVAAFKAGDKTRAWDVYAKTRRRTGHYFVEKLVQQFLKASADRDRKTASNLLAMLSFAADLEVERVGDHYVFDLARYYSRSTASQRAAVKRSKELMKSADEQYDLNKFDDARDLFARAEELYESNGDTCEALFARGWEVFSLVRVPDTRAGAAMLLQLSPILIKRNYRWLYAQTLNAIADIESSRDNLSEALRDSERSVKLSRDIEDPVGVLRNLGQSTSLYLQFGDYQKSLSKGFAGLETAGTVPVEAKQVWPLYYEMASAYLALDLSSAALAFGREALRLALEAQFPLIEARSYGRLGLIYRARSDYAEAMRNAQLAIDVGKRLSGRAALNTTASATLSLAHLNRLTGSDNSAIALYDQAIALYDQLGLDIYAYEAHKGKLLALIKLGDDVAVSGELPLTMKLYEEYRFKIAEESNKNRFFDTGHDLVGVAIDFEYSRMKNPRAAYDYAETARARSLFDLITGESAVVDGEGGPDNRLASTKRPLKLEEIQSQLPDDVQLLQYAVLEDKLVCWLVSKHGFDARDSKLSARELDQMVREYASYLAGTISASKATIVSKSKALYEVLVNPMAALLDPNKIVCIVPDGSLNYLPFVALISGTERYLIQDFKLQFSPSATVFVTCTEMARARSNQTHERLLSVGDPDFDRETFPLLPGLTSARTEAEAIAELYASKKLLLGNYARKEEVKKELLVSDVAHFATHYVPDPKSPMLSRLLLAKENLAVDKNGSYLSPAEIYRMKLSQTRLVVLSACRTGVEQTLRGEGAISVARPFLAAGVPVVVASLWPVETESTKDLMIALHSYRKVGRSTVDALREAQLELLDRHADEVGDSFTWAAFEAIGGRSEF